MELAVGKYQRAAKLAAGATFLLAATVSLAGYLYRVAPLRSLLPGQPIMVPNTAVALISAAVALWLRVPTPGRPAGIGLGLYICQGLVEAHGGRIWAESSPGERTTFTFSLPAAPEAGT